MLKIVQSIFQFFGLYRPNNKQIIFEKDNTIFTLATTSHHKSFWKMFDTTSRRIGVFTVDLKKKVGK